MNRYQIFNFAIRTRVRLSRASCRGSSHQGGDTRTRSGSSVSPAGGSQSRSGRRTGN